MKKFSLLFVAIVIGLFFFIFLVSQSKVNRKSTSAHTALEGTTIEPLGEMAIHDWSPDGTKLLGHKKDASGIFQVYTWNTDGTGEESLTNPAVLGGPAENCHKGFAHYHPSGRYVVMTVEMNFSCPKRFSEPGQASSTNLWVLDLEKKQWTNLTVYPAPKNSETLSGALSPYFSRDGKKVMWAKINKAANYLYPKKIFGEWELHLADFVSQGRPRIANDKIIAISNGNLFEPHGFSSEDKKILFSSDAGLEYSAGLELFEYDLETEVLKNLTNTSDSYDEHARYSPFGNKIVWGSTICCTSYNKKRFLGTLRSEVFLMNEDATNIYQVTHFNTEGYNEYSPTRTGNWPTAWSPDGTQIIVAQQFYDGAPWRSWKITLQTLP